uniref:SHSP domain-containing protein n=1 Tax=Oryza meridionalis TaxID=40149 RepID=A0A0E0C3Y9_9ORYZ
MSTCVPKGSRSAKSAAAEVEPRDVDLQPEVKWHDSAAGYVARLDLAGFRKEEFRVQVDGAGRVTVRGQRPVGHVRLHREFQLPPAADVDRIAARFDGATLYLTVPKRPASGAAEVVMETMEDARVAAAAAALELETERERAAGWDRGSAIAAAVAAFALGVVVSHRIFSTRNG